MNLIKRNRINVMELSKILRKIISCCLIFSILWQNSLWAIEEIEVLKEDISMAKVRTYSGRRAAIVEPGTIREGEIHNFFEDFQLEKEGGVLFTGAPDTTRIYNRSYSADPIHLRGIVEADYPLPMVFANPGGIVLKNPDFQNIHDLTLAAGTLAHTNLGMAYSVDTGSIIVNNTTIRDRHDVEFLTLAGGKIDIQASMLAPSKNLTLRAGRHIKGFKPDEDGDEWVGENHLNTHPLKNPSIILNDKSILSSKGLYLESLDEEASIYANGLLHSTEEDIIIKADGDVYLDKLSATRNLKIKTNGQVFLGNQAFFGGNVKIKAAHIVNQGNLIGNGQITFKAKQIQNDGLIQTKGKLVLEGEDFSLNGKVTAENGIVFNGLKKLEVAVRGVLSALGDGIEGTLETLINNGKMDLSSLNAGIGDFLNDAQGVIRTKGHLTLTGDIYTNRGTIFTCGIHQTTLTEAYADHGTIYAPTFFLLNAPNIEYFNTHKSYLKDAVISASFGTLDVRKGASFELRGNNDTCFLQFSSQSDLTFGGNISQFSSDPQNFPLLEYFKCFGEAPSLYKDFEDEIRTLHPIEHSLGSGINFQATGTIELEGIITQDCGPICVKAGQELYVNSKKIEAGHFEDDNISLICQEASLKDSNISSLLGEASLIAKESAAFEDTAFLGGKSTSVSAPLIWLDRSKLSSTHGSTTLQANQYLKSNDSSCEGNTGVNIQVRNLDFNSSQAKSPQGSLQCQVTNSGNINNSTFEAHSLSSLIVNDLSVTGSHFMCKEGASKIQAKQATIKDSSIKSRLLNALTGEYINFIFSSMDSEENNYIQATKKAEVKKSTFKGNTTIDDGNTTASSSTMELSDLTVHNGSLHVQGERIKTNGILNVEKDLNLNGKSVEQLAIIKAGNNININASEHYGDNENSRNEAEHNLFITAPNDKGFEGHQKAGQLFHVTLKDMNLFDFLNRSEARITKAYLTEAEIELNNDCIIDRTLELWGRSLKNKAKFTATKDFICHMQDLIMNEGSMIAQGDMTLETKVLSNFGLVQGATFTGNAEKIFMESPVEQDSLQGRRSKDKGHQDRLGREAKICATAGDSSLHAEEIQARGAKFEAKLNVNLKSTGALYIGAVQLSSEKNKSSRHSKFHEETLTNHKSQINAGKHVNIESGEGMVFEGVDVKAAGYIHVKSGDTLTCLPVHDIREEKKQSKRKGGFLGETKNENTHKKSDKVSRNTFKAGKDVVHESENDIVHQASRIESGGKTIIKSVKGKINIKADKSSEMRSRQKSSKSVVWQSQKQKGHFDETVEMLEILAEEGVHISAAQGIIAEIRGGKKQTQAQTLDHLEKHKETEWVKNLRKDLKATWHSIGEEHKKWNHKSQGLTGPAFAVIALALSMVTGGVGGELMGFVAGTAKATVASAAFTSVVTQATTSLINNKGNIGKTLNDLGSDAGLRRFAASVATTGMSNQVLKAGISALIQKQSLKGALLEAAKGALIDTVAGWGANQIKAWHDAGGIDSIAHKISHGALGAALGAVSSKNPGSGAFAGGVGGLLSETVAEAFEGILGKNYAANCGILAAGTTACLSKLDVDVAIAAATNAIENNFSASLDPDEDEGEEDEGESLEASFDEEENNIKNIVSISYGKKTVNNNEIEEQHENTNGLLGNIVSGVKEVYDSYTDWANKEIPALEKRRDQKINEINENIAKENRKLDHAQSLEEIKTIKNNISSLEKHKIIMSEMDISQGRWVNDLIDGIVDEIREIRGNPRAKGSSPNKIQQAVVKPNDVESKQPLSSPLKTTTKSTKTSITGLSQNSFNAKTPMAAEALNRKLSALESAQKNAFNTKILPDGRIRHYGELRFAKNEGPTAGSSYVVEYNFKTGQVRTWNECYTKEGTVNRVHPKMVDGNIQNSKHYPLTGKEKERMGKK